MVYGFLEDVYRELEVDREATDALVKRVLDVEAMVAKARKEGVIHIEEAALRLGDECTLELAVRVVDGVSVEDMETWFQLYYITSGGSPLDRLLMLISFVGMKAIARDDNPMVVEEMLLAMLPADARKSIKNKKEQEWEERERAWQSAYQSPYTISKDEQRKLDHWKSEESDFVLPGKDEDVYIRELCGCLDRMDDRAIQRTLREIENMDLTVAMRVWSSHHRRMIFNNMSLRLAALIADDLWNLERIHYEDAVEANRRILGVIRKLETAGEIVMTG